MFGLIFFLAVTIFAVGAWLFIAMKRRRRIRLDKPDDPVSVEEFKQGTQDGSVHP